METRFGYVIKARDFLHPRPCLFAFLSFFPFQTENNELEIVSECGLLLAARASGKSLHFSEPGTSGSS